MLEEDSRESPDAADNLLFLILLHLPITLSWKNTAQGGIWEHESLGKLEWKSYPLNTLNQSPLAIYRILSCGLPFYQCY